MRTWAYHLDENGQYVLMQDGEEIAWLTLRAGIDSGSWLTFIVDACNAAEALADTKTRAAELGRRYAGLTDEQLVGLAALSPKGQAVMDAMAEYESSDYAAPA